MGSFMVMVKIQSVLLIYMLIGVYARKKFVSIEGRQCFVDFMLRITLPCMVFESFNMDYNTQQLLDASFILVISFSICFLSAILGKLLYRRIPFEQRSIMQYGTLISNAGFAGLPLVQSTYGTLGLFYASVFLIPLRIFMWSAGISLFIQTSWKIKLKNLALNPGIIAVALGLSRMLLKIPIPAVVDTAIQNIGNSTASLSMIVVGMILADIPLRTVINRNSLLLCTVRLLALPVLVLIVLRMAGVEPLLSNVSVLLTAMPVGATTAMLAQRYGADFAFGSKCVCLSTALSLVTVPLISIFL